MCEVEVCLGYNWSEPTGIWTAAAVGPSTGVDVHVTAVQTHELFSFDNSSILSPITDGLNSLRCIPNRC